MLFEANWDQLWQAVQVLKTPIALVLSLIVGVIGLVALFSPAPISVERT